MSLTPAWWSWLRGRKLNEVMTEFIPASASYEPGQEQYQYGTQSRNRGYKTNTEIDQ